MIPTPRSFDLSRPRAIFVLRAVLLVPLVALSTCTDATGPDPAPESQDQIYFVSTRAGSLNDFGAAQSDIYRMNADGSGVERVTTRSSAYKHLRLSPDGTSLTLYASLGACYDIWVMKLDGSDLTQLTGVAGYERCNERPEWSPSGGMIAFVSSRNPQRGWEAYVINADGTGLVDIGNNPSTDFDTSYDGVDGWSPDGRVVLSSTRDGTERAYLVGADGSGLEPLFGSGEYLHPQWSPDGHKVIATSAREGNWELYAMNADGTGVVNLSANAAFDGPWQQGQSAWSPDGSRIAFYSRRTGDSDIFLVHADGTGLVNLTDDPAEDEFVAWSPDGTRILFYSDRGGDAELYLVDADGGTTSNVTNSPATVDGPDATWVPGR